MTNLLFNKNLIQILFGTIFLFSVSATAEKVTLTLNPKESPVTFLAVGKPSALKIRGTKGRARGEIVFDNENSPQGEVSVNLEELETGIETRDKHMKEKYLETEKGENKEAKLKFTKIELPVNFWKNPIASQSTFFGVLKLHGVEKEISGPFEITEASSSALKGTAKFSILLTDYGVKIPSFAGVTVAEKVDIEVGYKAELKTTN